MQDRFNKLFRETGQTDRRIVINKKFNFDEVKILKWLKKTFKGGKEDDTERKN